MFKKVIKKVASLPYRILVLGILYPMMDLMIGKQMRELAKEEKEKALSIVKHFQESKVERICDGISGNVQFKLEDGSWYIFKPIAKRVPNSTNWITLWEQR